MSVHITNETRKRLQRESDNRRNPDVIRTAEGLTRKRVRWPAEWGPSTVNQYCFTPAPMDTAESVQADAEPCDHEGIGAGLIGCAAELLVAHRMAQLRQERAAGAG